MNAVQWFAFAGFMLAAGGYLAGFAAILLYVSRQTPHGRAAEPRMHGRR